MPATVGVRELRQNLSRYLDRVKLGEALVVTERGLGKCSHIDDYRVQRRGGKGIITVNRTERTGNVVGVMEVLPEDEIVLITRNGVIIRLSLIHI